MSDVITKAVLAAWDAIPVGAVNDPDPVDDALHVAYRAGFADALAAAIKLVREEYEDAVIADALAKLGGQR